MSKTIVFRGPSISAAEVNKYAPGAICLSPVSQGDILTAVNEFDPSSIVIIDGYFETMPAVTHKEIIWALVQDIVVIGAASMGALRAAELQPFGMIGCGEIFESFCDGRLEDDDEVALTHAPRELDFIPTSDSMVDIRATLAAAEEKKIITQEIKMDLLYKIKSVYYKERSYDLCYSFLKEKTDNQEMIERFRNFIISNKINQKNKDALLALKTVSEPKYYPFCTEFQRKLPASELWISISKQYLDEENIKLEVFDIDGG